MWKAIVRAVRDVGNGTGDVTVEFFKGDVTVKTKTYNFTAGQITLETGRQLIREELESLARFDVLSEAVAGMIGAEIVLPEEVEGKIQKEIG